MTDDIAPSQHAQEHMEGENNVRLDLLERYEGFGKYEGELKLTEVLDGLDADEEAGDVEVTGFYRLYYITAEDVGGPIGNIVAAILSTSNEGFVTAEYYERNYDVQKMWDAIIAENAENEDDDDDSEE